MPDRPDLATLLADPTRAHEIPLEVIPGLLAAAAAEHSALAGVERVLLARLVAATLSGNGRDEDRLLTVEEAARRLAVTEDWLRRRPELPFVRKLSDGVVRYSLRAMEQWVATSHPRALTGSRVPV